MENLINEAKNVADSFFGLTKAIRNTSVLSQKDNEIVLIGVFTATGAARGLATHVSRALEYGATKDEIISAIILALPVVGISKVNQAIDSALQAIERFRKQN